MTGEIKLSRVVYIDRVFSFPKHSLCLSAIPRGRWKLAFFQSTKYLSGEFCREASWKPHLTGRRVLPSGAEGTADRVERSWPGKETRAIEAGISKDHNQRAKFVSFVLVVAPAVHSPTVVASREVARILCLNATVVPGSVGRAIGVTVSYFRKGVPPPTSPLARTNSE